MYMYMLVFFCAVVVVHGVLKGVAKLYAYAYVCTYTYIHIYIYNMNIVNIYIHIYPPAPFGPPGCGEYLISFHLGSLAILVVC